MTDPREFLRTNHRGVLATVRRDGRPQMSLVTVAIDAADRVIISSRERSAKVKNLRRDPHASVLVFTEAFYGDWVQLDGAAEIVSLPDAMDLLVDYYRRAAGEHPDWDEYRQAMRDEQRCVIRFAIERAGPAGR